MNRWGSTLLAAVLTAGVLAGCSSEDDDPPGASPSEPATSAGVPGLPPAEAVMAVVPADATVLTVTDFDAARLDLGFGEMSAASPAPVRADFERQAARRAPLLASGLLRPVEQRLVTRFGISQDDVAYEAHFLTPDGDGWLLQLHQDVDVDQVQAAVDAGVGPLDGATVYAPARVVAVGIVTDPAQSWAADPTLATYLGPTTAISTYVQRGCVSFETAFGADVEGLLAPAPADDVAALEPLDGFSVTFGPTLVTARLGEQRDDAFDRAGLAASLPSTDPDFGVGFEKPVADPAGGRIGYRLGDPQVATALTLQQALPFAVCADD